MDEPETVYRVDALPLHIVLGHLAAAADNDVTVGPDEELHKLVDGFAEHHTYAGTQAA